MWFPHIAIDLVFVLDMVILYVLIKVLITCNIMYSVAARLLGLRVRILPVSWMSVSC